MDIDPIVPELEKKTRRRRMRQAFNRKRIPVRMMVPSIFTLLGLCAGLTAIRMGLEGRYVLAVGAIVLAAFLDFLDGRMARLLKASTRFGAELDSLADFVNFGVAPALLLFIWGLSGQESLGWIAVMLFAIASALRLARYNIASTEDRPPWYQNFFIGVPTSAAAIIVLLPLYLSELGLDIRTQSWGKHAIIGYVIIIGTLMVSIVPTYSAKLLGERIGREWVLPILIIVMAVVACSVTYPFETLALASLAYLLSIPLSWRTYKRFTAKEDEAKPNKPIPSSSAAATPDAASTSDDGANVVEMRGKP